MGQTLHDYFDQDDLQTILDIFDNIDFLAIKVLIGEQHARTSPVTLLRSICLSIKEAGEILTRYTRIESLGIELIGLSIQLYDYSEYILQDDESIALLEIIVQENHSFFKNAHNIPLDGYENHLKPTIFESMDQLLRKLPKNHK